MYTSLLKVHILVGLFLFSSFCCSMELQHHHDQQEFFKALMKGRTSDVKKFLQAGVSPNTANDQGILPLFMVFDEADGAHETFGIFDGSSLYPALSLIQLLLHAGAGLKGMDKEGKTPLHLAIDLARDDIVEYLLMWGADPNGATYLQQAPLTYCLNKSVKTLDQKLLEIAELLILFGADIRNPHPLVTYFLNHTLDDHFIKAIIRNDKEMIDGYLKKCEGEMPGKSNWLWGRVKDILSKRHIKPTQLSRGLDYAAVAANLDIVQKLLNAGALPHDTLIARLMALYHRNDIPEKKRELYGTMIALPELYGESRPSDPIFHLSPVIKLLKNAHARATLFFNKLPSELLKSLFYYVIAANLVVKK